jgi:hypothetical protein
MNSTATPRAVEPNNAPIALADEQLTRAHQQIEIANEELTRLSEQLAKMERDAARPPSAGPDPQAPQLPPRRPMPRVLVGLPLVACIVAAALVLQSSYGGGVKLHVARWAPRFVSTPSLPPENAPLLAQAAPSAVRVAAAGAAPPATPPAPTASQNATPTVPLPAPTTPQDAMPPATAALPDPTQLLQTIAADLANMQRDIEQLKANQKEMASDNLRAIEQIKASQEEMKRQIARISEQNLSKPSPPPMQPTTTSRKPQRRLYPPYERELPPISRWDYEEW